MTERLDDTSAHDAGATPAQSSGKSAPTGHADAIDIFLSADPSALSVDAANATISKLRNDAFSDPAHPYNNPHHPRHREVTQKLTDMYERAYPGQVDDDTTAQMVLAGEPGPPERPENYSLDSVKPQNGVSLEDAQAQYDLVRGWAHEASLSQAELGEIIQDFNRLPRMPEAYDDAFDEAHAAAGETALRAVWGQDYDAKVAAAQRAAEKLGPEFIEFAEATRLGNEPRLIRLLASVAERKNW